MVPPILLVEDNPMDVDLTRRAFQRHGDAVILEVARDGEEALAWIGKWDAGAPRPAVILLDLNLPKVHGLEVLRVIKAHPEYKIIPVVILTTSREDADLKAAYRNGVNSYLVKPVRFEAFVDIADQICRYWGELNTRYSAGEGPL